LQGRRLRFLRSRKFPRARPLDLRAPLAGHRLWSHGGCVAVSVGFLGHEMRHPRASRGPTARHTAAIMPHCVGAHSDGPSVTLFPRDVAQHRSPPSGAPSRRRIAPPRCRWRRLPVTWQRGVPVGRDCGGSAGSHHGHQWWRRAAAPWLLGPPHTVSEGSGGGEGVCALCNEAVMGRLMEGLPASVTCYQVLECDQLRRSPWPGCISAHPNHHIPNPPPLPRPLMPHAQV